MDKLFVYCANSNLVYKLFNNGDGLSDGAEVLKYGTDPLVPDSDGDGISDGAEVQNLSRMQINSSLWSAILHTKDYDGDGIPDGYELATAYWIYENNKTAWRAGRYLNPTNGSDIYLDFDNDTLSNIEEYQRDPAGDFDGDGTPDIYDWDDDNDSILTSVEVQSHLNPYDPWDAAGDSTRKISSTCA